MASTFSWTDTLQIAFSSCLPCIKPAADNGEVSSPSQQNLDPTANRIPRARHDELQGLLMDPDTDGEAETMSLHSNPGNSRRGKNKKRKSKRLNNNGSNNPRSITLFGYSLFGVPVGGGVQLPDDGEDALYANSRHRPRQDSLAPSTILTTHSSSTFDSDAAPLESAVIDALSSPTAVAAAAQASAEVEAQRQKEKEERRQRRREKKEMKRLAEALALERGGDDGEFEGFQGSGDLSRSTSGYPRIPNSMRAGGTTASDSGSGSAKDGYGHFVSAPKAPRQNMDDEDDDAADLDGGLYASKARHDGQTNNGSDSRSRTSASVSERDRERDRAAHHFPDPRNVLARVHHSHSHSLSQSSSSRLNSPLQAHFQPQPQSQGDLAIADLRPRSKSKSSRSKSANKSHSSSAKSSTTASESPSIPSPLSPNFPAGIQQVVSPSTIEQGQGFFDLEEEELPQPQGMSPVKPTAEFPSTRIGGGSFPITGFGNPTGGSRTRDLGAFLASRGDDDHSAVDGL